MTCLALTALSTAQSRAENLPQVRLDTSLGEIVIEVDAKRAPISAGEFLRYTDAGLYNGGAFYRIVRADNDPTSTRIDVIQGGLTTLDRGPTKGQLLAEPVVIQTASRVNNHLNPQQ
jgi:hypothetical protein